MKNVFLGIGSNLGDRAKNLKTALDLIKLHIGVVSASSSVWETEPWGFSSEELFLNMAVEVETKLNASGLLGRILMIEAGMGRLRNDSGYSSRIIDIDILFYGNRIIKTRSLVLPHQKIQERKFVLEPLNEIASGFIHPLLGKDISTLLAECTDKGKVRRLE
ncbi:MAG: 2-amino-4-hydroxy-6-hydroxymethyldihydropteridine diphosphokinase [Bacteroidales bacterium]|nr:2-amino-4-hydroxy-6-hydroxymethyldihydropteridine diphosphokinase [Bacteroidales bacterium]MBN2633745.1 2-amino-4-hydroxy-6-hydroxymethyldihydropteridine diphosphokinase [Bacteroidales bacterium]